MIYSIDAKKIFYDPDKNFFVGIVNEDTIIIVTHGNDDGNLMNKKGGLIHYKNVSQNIYKDYKQVVFIGCHEESRPHQVGRLVFAPFKSVGEIEIYIAPLMDDDLYGINVYVKEQVNLN